MDDHQHFHAGVGLVSRATNDTEAVSRAERAHIVQDPIRVVIPTVDYTLTIEGAPELPADAT